MDGLLGYLLQRPWELLAVALSIAYVVLAAREHIACWACALGATAIYTLLFWRVYLPMESALNAYYLVMALYGWQQWRRGAQSGPIKIHRWQARQHLAAAAVILLLTVFSALLLQRFLPSAALPWLDSFTTWASVVTTWMVARKVLENWLYWVVIDAVSIYLYLDRGMHLTALLFVAYVIIALVGWFTWKKHFENRIASTTA